MPLEASLFGPGDGLLLLIGAATGLLSGLLGVGGGFILVPLLVITGRALPVAIGTSLFYVVVVGLGGALTHLRARNLDARFVATLALPAVVGAQLGALLSGWFADWLLAMTFAAFLLAVALSMVAPGGAVEVADGRPPVGPTLGVGGLTGLLSGLFGVGGGVVLVPAQVRLFGIPMRRAVGNSLAAIVVTGLSGVIAHTWLGHVEWRACAILVPGGLVGLQAGTWLLRRLPANRLKSLLAAFMVVMALYMGLRGYGLWAAPAHAAPPSPARSPANAP